MHQDLYPICRCQTQSHCPVGNSVVIVPSAGATNVPFAGSMAIPLPIAPDEKTWSFTSFSGTTLPAMDCLIRPAHW